MKKVFFIAALLIVAIVIAVAGSVAYVLHDTDRSAADKLSNIATQAFKVPVGIGQTSISLSDGPSRIVDLRVENPPGFGNGFAITAPTINWETSGATGQSKTIYIDQLVIDEADIILEINAGATNLNLLKKAVDAFAKHASDDEPPIVIREALLTGGNLTIRAADFGGDVNTVSIPDTRIRNIGSIDAPASHADIAHALTRLLLIAIERATRRLDLDVDLPKAADAPPLLQPQ